VLHGRWGIPARVSPAGLLNFGSGLSASHSGESSLIHNNNFQGIIGSSTNPGKFNGQTMPKNKELVVMLRRFALSASRRYACIVEMGAAFQRGTITIAFVVEYVVET
jgi:hypothetical protein